MAFWSNDTSLLNNNDASVVIPDGDYSGQIASVNVKTTQAGQHVLNVKLSLGDYTHWMSMNLEHPKAAEITRRNITIILNSAYSDPPTQLETLDDVASALLGVPVKVKLKRKMPDFKDKPQYNIFFAKVPEADKLTFAGRLKDY